MDIKVTITKVLKDETWGFSDLLHGRELNDETRVEIEELILEDISDILDEGIWISEKAD